MAEGIIIIIDGSVTMLFFVHINLCAYSMFDGLIYSNILYF